MIRRPPRSTPFPTRRSSDLVPSRITTCAVSAGVLEASAHTCRSCTSSTAACPDRLSRTLARSEEHTSELQSQSNLVCRLLLEKKKKNIHDSVAMYAPQIDRS